MLITLVSFFVILSLLVLVHELGHFVVARRYGVHVDEFGLGFPPRLMGVYRDVESRRFHLVGRGVTSATATIYSINWVPLGGFVKIKGEQGEAANEPDSFGQQRIRRRLAILSAGVAMNALLTVTLLSLGFTLGLPQVIADPLPPGAVVSGVNIQIVEVVAGLPAEAADLQTGDVLASFDGQRFTTLPEVQQYLDQRTGNPVTVVIERRGERLTRTVVPTFLPETGRGGFGMGLVRTGVMRFAPHRAIWMGTQTTLTLTQDIMFALGGIVRDLVYRRPVALDVSGPVGIAVVSGEVTRLGWRYLLPFTALLSLNLAIVNFLPFPALDGGRVAFLLIERFRGRAVNARVEAIIHHFGFILLMLLVLLITYRDIARLVTRAASG